MQFILKSFSLKTLLLLPVILSLIFIEPGKSYCQDSLRDLSGTWIGTQINGNLVMYYEISIKKTGQNTYAGFDYCKWQRNKDGTPLNIRGEMPQAKKIFFGSFDGDVFWFSEIGNIENSNWGLLNEQLKFLDNDGTPELWDNDKSQPARKFHLTRSSDIFPEKYVKYTNLASLLKITSLSYNNPTRSNHIKYNESGEISISVKNNSDIDFNKLDVKVTASNSDLALLQPDNPARNAFDIKNNISESLNVSITSGFLLPAGSIHLVVSLNANGVTLAEERITLASETFFKTEALMPGVYSNPRMKAISCYYGFLNNTYSDVSNQLNSLVASGDKIAGMWKSIFMYLGIGGYKPDEIVALNLGKDCLNAVESHARNGEPEAIYLMYYACQMGLEGHKAKYFGTMFLEMAANANFKPAVYDYALSFYLKKNFNDCYSLLRKSFDMGIKKSASIIGIMYEKGYSVDMNIDSAVMWYDKGINFGDPDAMYHCSILYAHGDSRGPNIDKSTELVTKAAEGNCAGAMFYLANIYFHGGQGKSQDVSSAIKWFTKSAEFGDREGMYALAAIYTDADLQGVTKDEKTAFIWAKKAAELGQPQAMKMLAKFYSDGVVVGKNIIKSRYWFNQSVLKGEATAESFNTSTEDLLNIWRFADFSPSYYYVDSYGNYLGDDGPDLFGGLLTGFLGSYFESRMRTQPMINGLEFIQNKNDKKIYGGTITSQFTSTLELKKGQTVHISAYGAVTLGWMLSNIPADGINNSMYAIYSIVPDINHGAVMAGMNNYWQFIGRSNDYTAWQEGRLNIAINDADYTNNQGYFDVVIEATEE